MKHKDSTFREELCLSFSNSLAALSVSFYNLSEAFFALSCSLLRSDAFLIVSHIRYPTSQSYSISLSLLFDSPLMVFVALGLMVKVILIQYGLDSKISSV